MRNLKAHINKISFLKILTDCSQKLNTKSYLIGGYVRDLLLNKPCKDIDIMCLNSGIQLAEEFRKTLLLKDEKEHLPPISIFKNYGTAMIKYKGYQIEFVGARKESYKPDSRNPIVSPGTLKDDQKRRDFTINALAISLNKKDYGDLSDPFNGLEHLEKKVITTPLDSDITFSDDPLRMLRAIRFSTQLDFKIPENILNSIEKNALRIKILSQERITSELNKIILSSQPSKGFVLLEKVKLLPLILQPLQNLKGVEIINNKTHKDNFYHTLQVLDNVAEKSNSLWLRWAALLHDIAKPQTKRFDPHTGWHFHGHEFLGAKMIKPIFNKLKLPLNKPMFYVKKLVQLHLRPIALINQNVTDSAIRRLLFDAGEDIEDLMILCNADITSKNEHKIKQFKNNFKLVEKKLKEIEGKDHLRNFQTPITGSEIINTLKLSPSKIIGDIKTRIKNAILEGEIGNNHKEALEYMLKIAKEMNL